MASRGVEAPLPRVDGSSHFRRSARVPYHKSRQFSWMNPFQRLVHLTPPEVSMIFLTRRATFSASHFYWNPEWTEEKNRAVFGRCANRNGHGHNYTLEVTVAGEPDPVTGFVVDLKWLKDVMEDNVLSAWDHRHLNLEVPEFHSAIPTTENIAISAWRRLQPPINAIDGARLSRIRVYETADIFAEFRGEA